MTILMMKTAGSLSSSEQEENSGLTTYNYTYDKVGNRLSYVKKTQTTRHPDKADVAESAFYRYNDSNQLVSAELFDGKKSTAVTYKTRVASCSR